MIISASYKTDIPAFYGEWFMNRLQAGYCKVVNPYNRQLNHVNLQPDKVDGFVFWTKNIGPFTKHLPEVQLMGFPFIIQHTINSYPRALEKAVIKKETAIEQVRRISDRFGPRVCVWRYDTIINSSVTPREHHLETFSQTARALEGAVDEVVISFARFYQKTQRNMRIAGEENGFVWSDPDDEWKNSLAIELASIAASHQIKLTVCGQPQRPSATCDEAHCVDAIRLSEIASRPLDADIKGNREGCACFKACDIGEYDTCPHGCVYCYAVRNQSLASRRYRQHDPLGETLCPQSRPTESPTPAENKNSSN